MKNVRGLTLAAAVALTFALPPIAYAVDTPEDHAAHHPANAPPAPTAPQVDAQMKCMQDMHQQMQAATTPEQRAALMKDHMAAMQGGMAMMAQMKSGTPHGAGKQSMGNGSMNERMDMMEMMMQMMMDREGAGPSSIK